MGIKKLEAQCVLCLDILPGHHALIAPWICELSEVQVPYFTYFYQCSNCDYSWFQRCPPELLEATYLNYRNNLYFSSRNFWEPWFSRNENNFYSSANSENVHERKFGMSALLSSVGLNISTIDGVLDFGGDRGQFIPSEAVGIKYVVDPSVKSNDELDIEKSRDESNCTVFTNRLDLIPNNSIGLVMACMVLEHIQEFDDFFEGVRNKLREDGLVYIEVPLDRFKVKSFHRSETYRRWLDWASRNRLVFIILDFFTGINRLLFRSIPVFGVIKAAEHINYFSLKSLSKLVHLHNGTVVTWEIDLGYRQGKIRLGSLKILCKFS